MPDSRPYTQQAHTECQSVGKADPAVSVARGLALKQWQKQRAKDGALQERALWTGGNRSNRSKGVNFCLSFGAAQCPTFVCEVRIGAAWARCSKCEVL